MNERNVKPKKPREENLERNAKSKGKERNVEMIIFNRPKRWQESPPQKICAQQNCAVLCILCRSPIWFSRHQSLAPFLMWIRMPQLSGNLPSPSNIERRGLPQLWRRRASVPTPSRLRPRRAGCWRERWREDIDWGGGWAQQWGPNNDDEYDADDVALVARTIRQSTRR